MCSGLVEGCGIIAAGPAQCEDLQIVWVSE